MKRILFGLHFFIVLSFTGLALLSCNTNSKPENGQQVKITESSSPVSAKKSKERKQFTALVEAQIGGKELKMTSFDQAISTDVVLLDNGIQFRIDDTNKQSLQVNMYAPQFADKIPISISQQSAALSADEVSSSKTNSRLEVVIPSDPPVQGDTKILYEGSVSLDELTGSKLVVTFQGKGISYGDNRKNLFPMHGKIVLENFNVYDGRTK
ncbi:MAG: hypothetical protein R2821_12670 [Flavobacteriaceae bacterium]